MADNDKREEDRAERYAIPPSSSELPAAPKIEVKLPPRSEVRQPGAPAPGAYRKVAIAATAASSFVSPIIVLGVAGWWLDQRLHLTIGLCAFLGTVLGFIAGIVALLQVIRQLNH